MARSAVSLRVLDPVSVIRIDDGRANVLTSGLINDLWGALDVAETDSQAVVIAGRTGVFSGGLDLDVLREAGDDAMMLAHKATEVCLRLAEFPRPVVAACTGHAVALGAVLLLCSDYRICAEGDFRIGFNEVSIGLPVPELMVGLARERLATRHLTMAVNCAEMYAPRDAVEVGFLDRAHSMSVMQDAVEKASEMAERLDPEAFAATRRTMTRRLGEAIIRHAGAFGRIRSAPPVIRDSADSA